MKTVICVGCSWTYGYNIEVEETYPKILEKSLDDTKVINAGHCGADIDYTIYSASKLIDFYRPNLVLFQLSTLDRLTLGTDGYENFINDKFVDSEGERIYQESDRLLGIGNGVKTKIAVGSYINKDKSREFKESTMRTTIDKYSTFIEVLFENVVHSNYSFYKLKNNLKLFHAYAKSKGTEVIYFRWLNSTPIEPLCENLPYKIQAVEDIIDSSLFIDNGFHLDSIGNERVVNEFILPLLKEKYGL